MQEESTIVLIEGCYDVFHFGHLNAIRQAKNFGSHLVVGINDEETAKAHKNTLLTTSEERLEIISGLKWVDSIICDAPYVLDYDLVKKFGIDIVTHGDDLILTEDGRDIYDEARADGRFRTFRRTFGISTTEIVGRLLLRTHNFERFSQDTIDYLNDLEHKFSQPYVDNLGSKFARIPVYTSADAGKVNILDGIRKSAQEASTSNYVTLNALLPQSNKGYKIIAQSPFISENDFLNPKDISKEYRTCTCSTGPIAKNIQQGVESEINVKNPENQDKKIDPFESTCLSCGEEKNCVIKNSSQRNPPKIDLASDLSSTPYVENHCSTENLDPNILRSGSVETIQKNDKNKLSVYTDPIFFDGSRGSHVVYISGVFDLYHAGHAALIRHASMLGRKLLVGLFTDSSVRKSTGEEPVMSSMERKLVLLGNKFIDEIVYDAPYNITEDFIKKHQITRIVCTKDTRKIYEHLENIIEVVEIRTKFDYLSKDTIVQRILNNYSEYAQKIKKLEHGNQNC